MKTLNFKKLITSITQNVIFRMDEKNKKRLWLFLVVAFGIPAIMSIPMIIGAQNGIDIKMVATMQMMYPACGVILGMLLVNENIGQIPRAGFITVLIITGLCTITGLWSILDSGSKVANTVTDGLLTIGSLTTYILFWTCGRKKRENSGIERKNIKSGAILIGLFIVLYISRSLILNYWKDSFLDFRNIETWSTLALAGMTFPLYFVLFFGEEYGWRYYLQPILQQKFGIIKGTLLLGVVWGLWYWDFIFTKTTGYQILTYQIITCVCLSIFLAYAYMKTGNIWVTIIMRFIFFVCGEMYIVEDIKLEWIDLPWLLVSNLVFAVFIFAPVFKGKNQISNN